MLKPLVLRNRIPWYVAFVNSHSIYCQLHAGCAPWLDLYDVPKDGVRANAGSEIRRPYVVVHLHDRRTWLRKIDVPRQAVQGMYRQTLTSSH